MKNSTTDDKISNLPDELLSHILSFLPTKQAFTTTLLSKRWAPICYSLSVLEFNDRDYDNDTIDGFYRFVDTLMLSPSARNQPIKTFDLMCRSSIYDVDPNIYDVDRQKRFDAWVEAAKRRRVEKFHLEVRYITLNPTIFTSKTLVVLKLDWLDVEAHNFCADLPSLKTLHLRHVCFENQNDFMKLLNSCPILQDLHTYNPRNSRHNEIHEVEEFNSFLLSKLVRADISSMDVPFNAICNVDFLHIRINIRQACFKVIPVFRNLIHIQLWFYGFFHGWYRVVQFLQHCPKLQILNMRKLNSRLVQELECPISVLECVSSHLRSCTILNFEGSANDLRFATYVLQNARVLQDMTIDVTTNISNGRLLEKSKIIEELSLCPRISIGCKLSFN